MLLADPRLFFLHLYRCYGSVHPAALKCRQRKKAWLAQLQAKVEYLQNENERLTQALVTSREEITRLSALVGAGVMPGAGVPGGGNLNGVSVNGAGGMGAQMVSGPPGNQSLNVGLPQGKSSAVVGGRGYGY